MGITQQQRTPGLEISRLYGPAMGEAREKGVFQSLRANQA